MSLNSGVRGVRAHKLNCVYVHVRARGAFANVPMWRAKANTAHGKGTESSSSSQSIASRNGMKLLKQKNNKSLTPNDFLTFG